MQKSPLQEIAAYDQSNFARALRMVRKVRGMGVSDELRDVMQHSMAMIATGEARLYEQVQASFNWLLGTLFASNGGALIALVGRDDPVAPCPLACFAAGVVFSILMGLASTVYASKAIIPMTDVLMTMRLLVAGEATPEQLQDKMSALNAFGPYKWAMHGAGYLSLACLVIGMITFARTM